MSYKERVATAFEYRDAAWKRSFLNIVAFAFLGFAAIVILVSGLIFQNFPALGISITVAVTSFVSLILTRRQAFSLSTIFLCYGISASVGAAYAISEESGFALFAMTAVLIVNTLTSESISRLILLGFQILLVTLASIFRLYVMDIGEPEQAFLDVLYFTLSISLVFGFVTMLRIRRVEDGNEMLRSTKEQVIHKIGELGGNLGISGTKILGTMRTQERGVFEQTTAVEEIEKAMQTLLGFSREVSQRCAVVAANAKRDFENTKKMEEKIRSLAAYGQAIQELIDFVKDVANKADLLALNAALEGARAGETGRGFGLVASQMQRLAEQVMRSSQDIEELASEISSDTEAAVIATEESTARSTETAKLAEEISLITRQQESGTEQVSHAIADILKISKQNVSGTRQVISSASHLKEMSETLLVLTKKIEEEASKDSTAPPPP